MTIKKQKKTEKTGAIHRVRAVGTTRHEASVTYISFLSKSIENLQSVVRVKYTVCANK